MASNLISSSRTVVITGVTRGIGLALAEEFIGRGHRLVGCGRNAQQVRELSQRWGRDHSIEVVDVSSDPQVAAWGKGCIARYGAPDLLINNAAVINTPAPLWQVSAAEFNELLQVNLIGVASVIRAFVPSMIEKGCGTIVQLSSGWGRSTAAGMAPYCTSKWGIEGLSRSLADDLPAGMCSVAVSPGVVHTEMLEIALGVDSASQCTTPREWSRRAVPFLLDLGSAHNGASLSTP